MQRKQIFARLITILVILAQVLAGVSGALPAQVALAAAPTPPLVQPAKPSEASAAASPAVAAPALKAAAPAGKSSQEALMRQTATRNSEHRATGAAGSEWLRPISPEVVAAAPVAKPLAAGGPASISGLVYSDFNANGVKDTSDVGVGGITVTAYDATNTALASTTASTATATSGQYTLSGLPANTPVRLEFTTLPTGYQPAVHGAVNGTAVQLVTTTSGALSNVNFGVTNPVDYSQSNPSLVTPLYINGDTSTIAPTGTLVKFAYDSTSGSAAPAALATKAQIGSTWGLAYARMAQTLYTAAFLKRHVGLGPNGPGAIYAVNINGGAPTLFADLAALGANVGTVASNSTRGLSNPGIPSNDPTSFDQVGKVGLGDIDLSDDERTLYAVSLNDKKLYVLNAPAGTLAGSYAIPDPGCTGGAWRPFALKFKQGVLYVGGVCDAQTSQDRANLKAYVYRFTPGANTFSQVLNFPLNYGKGPATGPCCGLAFAGWYPWLSTFDTTKINTSVQAGIVAVYPQPILADLEFDVDGSLILGFTDRFGHQTGDRNYGTTGTTSYDGLVGGDILRACPDAAGNWVLEAAGACGGVTGGGANGQGPGGGEFYKGDYFSISSFETSMGGLALKPGSGEVALTVMDPQAYITGGVTWLSNTTGAPNRRFQVYDATRIVYFGKANGLGDLELLADPSPIEIGNRVWLDRDADGIQDAGEPSLVNVAVSLYDSSNKFLATVATDAQGAYYFSSAAGTDTANTKYNVAALKFNTSGYQLRIDTTQPALRGLGLTTTDADSSANGDARDSDGQMSGNNAVITFATGVAGANNHTYDFGFKFTGVGIGNYVWKDNNADNLQDATDTPLTGLTVGLYQSNGNPVLCAQGQSGYYLDTGAGATDSAGTLNWAGQPWTFNSATTTTGGNPGNTVIVYGSGTATRPVDLSVFAGYPTLSYDVVYHYTTDTYSHTVEYSTDSGVNWQFLAHYTDNSTATTWKRVAYVLPTLSANARIRIRGGAGGTFNYLGIDNLRLEGPLATAVTTVTDAQGHYGFDSTNCMLPSTQYQVRIATAQTPLIGLSLATPDAGGVTSNDPTGDDSDSDASSVTISSTLYARILATSPATGVNNSYDFGFLPVEIGNYVWKDTNANGLQESGEAPIAGVTVSLYDASGNAVMCTQVGRYDTYLDQFSTTANTNSNGTLNWSSKAWVQTGASISASNGNPGGALQVNGGSATTFATRPVDLSVFATQPTLSFGYNMVGTASKFNIQYSSNGGTSFTTLATLSDNNNGYKSITYTLPITVANAQIRIAGFGTGGGTTAYFDNLTIRGQVRYPVTDVTDSDGLYLFTGANCVQPNTNYQVRIDTTQTPANPLYGLFLTTPNAGGVTSNDPTGDDNDSDASTVTISGVPNAVINARSPALGLNYSYDFGFTPLEIGNYVWKDSNLNGLQDNGEPGIADVTVGLYDNSGNLALCKQPSTANLALNKPATQVSDFSASNLAGNAVDGNTASGASITNSSLNSWWQVDLGQSAMLRQVVLYARTDGFHTQTEQVYVFVSNQPFASNTLATTLADANVWHSTLQGVWTGASLTVAVPNYLGRYVRIQHNNTDYLALNEVQVFGDPALPITTITDSTGHYTFTGASCLQPSTGYQVRIATDQMALRGLYPTTPNAGGVTSNSPTGDDSDSDATSITISNTIYARTALTSPVAGVNYSYDFGFAGVEIGNYVWKDTNTNGTQDSGEPGIPNVTLNLYRNNAPVMCGQDQTSDYLDTGASATDSAGSLNWAGQAWTFSSAGVMTSGGNPGNSVYIYGNGTATRAVDLSVFSDYPTVSYDYAYANTATGYSHVVEYSTDGGVNWQTAQSHTISSGVTYQSASFTLPSVSATARIRIRGTAGTTGNYLKVDNLHIEGLVASPATAVTDSAGLYSFDGRCVQPNTTYQVRLDTTQPAVKGLYVTTPNAGGITSNDPTLDDTDSDAITTTLNYKTWAVINATALAGGMNPSYDFGLVEVGIGNYVWKDTNTNGLQDSGEPVLPEVAVSLYNANGTPLMCVYNKSGDYLDTGASATDSAGSLNWAGQAWTFSSAGVTTSGGNPGNNVYVYGNGTATRAVDLSVFGEYPTVSYDYVYANTTTGYSHVVEYSTNGGTTWQTLATYTTSSGTAYQSASFTLPSLSATARIRIRGTAGTTTNYLRIDNLRIAGGLGEPVKTFTDFNGHYSFTGTDCVQPNGQYQVRLDRMQSLLRGLYLTTPNAGGVTSNHPTLDDSDSDAISTTVSSIPYAVVNATAPAAGFNPSYDFGFVEVGIGNYVWRDTNTDGVQDANEPGIAGVTVGLYDNSGNPVLCVQDQTKYYLDTGASTTDSAGTLDWSGKAWTFTSASTTTGGNPGNTVSINGNGTATRAVDLAVFGAYPILSYDYAYANATTGYSHVVEYSTDGGTTWQTLATYSDSAGTAYQSVNFTLPTLSANARLRIRGTAGATGNALKVDNLRIEGGVATPATAITDGDGHYGFDGRCVQPTTQYQVRIDTLQDVLFGLYLTKQNADGVTSNDPTADDTDSDASTVVSGSARNAVISLTAPAAGVNNSYDFGFISVEIGNYVWKDNNTNGLQESGEPSIPGVTVGLYDASGNQVMCPQVGRYDTYLDQFTTTANTNSNGTLDWSSKAWVQTGTAISASNGNPGGALQVNGGSATTFATRPVDLSVFAGNPTLSFGYNMVGTASKFNIQYSSNGGTSFTTLATLSDNNNGYKSITYTLPITVANAQIRIAGFGTGGGTTTYFDNLTIRGQVRYPVATVTDADGLYTFTGANCVQPNTNYQVRIDTTQDPLVGLFPTGQNAGGVTSNDPTADDSDSDASTVTINGKPNAVINAKAPAAGVNYSYDFGFIPVEIGNYVWKDNNTNGLQDSGEPPLAGVTVGLYDANGNQVMCPQVGRYDTYADAFNSGLSNGSTGSLTWGTTWSFAGSAAAYTAQGNPGGSMFVYGVTTSTAVRALDLSVFTGPPTLSFDYIRGNGAASFNIQYSNNGGTSFTTLANLSVNNLSYQTITYTLPITVANAQIRIQGATGGSTLYAYFDNVTIRGQVRYPVTTMTDANGLYTFTSAQCVQPNTNYQVRIDTTQDPLVGLFPTGQNAGGVTSNDPTADDTDSDASSVTINGKANAVINAKAPAAGVNYSYDFGFIPVEIGNYVWRDDNLNGRQETGEPPLAGVTVGLYDASGNQVMCPQVGRYDTYLDQFTTTANTNSNGTLNWSSKAWVQTGTAISASNGNPGGALQVNGGSATTFATRPVDLSVFAGNPTLSFGYNMVGTASKFNIQYSSNGGASFTTLATLSDNNNGYKSITYTLPITVANAQIRIAGFGTGGGTTAYFDNLTIRGQVRYPVTTVTDSNGLYLFTGANCVQPNANYQVRIDTTQAVLRGLFLTSQNAGGVTSNDPTADDNDSDAGTVTINGKANAVINAKAPAAGVNYSYDFGFVPVVIGNYVWKDTNADGLQTTDEPPLAGVTVGLYDNSGNAVQCTQTGRYDTYQDSFNTASVNNGSTGTLIWDRSWRHFYTAVVGTNGNPGGSLRGYGNPSYYTTRAVDLSVFAGNPTLRLDYNFGGAALSFAIQYSSDGGTTFQTLATLSGNNNTYKTITYTLPITATTAQIRIQGVSGNNYAYFDNITLQGQRRYPVTDVTDANGLYTFSGVECLEPSTPYQVRINTAQNALFGFALTTPNAGGVTSNSPTGDDSDSDASGVTLNSIPYAVTSFTSPAVGANYSYDFGFGPSPVGSLQVNKTVKGTAAPAGWRFTLSSDNCVLPPSLTNPITTTNGAGGSVTFANLLVKNGANAVCQYQVSEKSQTSWFLNYVASDPMTGIKVAANSTTPVAVVNEQTQTCNAGSGNVGGLVFQDFNMDGQQNNTTKEPAFTGGVIAVRAYGKNNQLLASVPLQPDGSYVFPNLPNLTTDGVRIEFQNLGAAGVEPTTYTAAASTTNRVSKGAVRFVKAATCNADLGVNRPVNYCQVNPNVAMVPYNIVLSNPSLVEVPYTASGTQVNDTTTGQTGSIWGLAYQKSTNTIFMGAFYKPGLGFGTLGSGGIYAYNRATKTFSPFVNLQTLGITTGPVTGLTPVNDVGKVALGDIDISEDGKTLYIMNMYQRELVLLDIATKSITQRVPVPDPGCKAAGQAAPQDRRPWGIAVHEGTAYIGITCSAETSHLTSDLYHYVMKLQGNTFVPFFDFPATRQGKQHPWGAWQEGIGYYKEPILADFEFDVDGSLVLATSDRNGYKWDGEIHGDGGVGALVRACNVNGTLVFEGGAGCRADYYSPYSWGNTAGIALVPGTGEVVSNDLLGEGNFQGLDWLSNLTGNFLRIDSVSQSYGKATGVGDVEALCNPAPLEIGNRVWNDSVQPNGVQDPNEPGISGVIVGLYNITGTLVSTTTTNAVGEYYFNNANVPGGLKENTNYTIRINRTQPPLNGLSPTLLNQVLNNPLDPDEHDSDGNQSTYVGYVTTPVRTGSAGQNDYSYDFGFTSARYDWGDNPDNSTSGTGSYNTVMTNTGAIHVVVSGLHLGATEDGEINGQPNSTATGDGADEDGVQFPTLKVNTTAVITVTATNTGSTPATLYGWIDFNGDDQFSPDERVSTSVPAGVTDGVFLLTFNVPLDAVDTTYARFRLSTDPAAAQPTGVALDGEVEDYQVMIQGTVPAQFGDRVWIESDTDGLANTGTLVPVAGMVITASNFTQSYTATTNSQGYYSFTVPAGAYVVRYGSVPASYGTATPSATPGGSNETGNAGSYQQSGNPDQSHTNGTSVTVGENEANWQVDFAFNLQVKIGNRLWIESDNDGDATTGTVTPVVGQVVTATNGSGVVYTAVTDANGLYTITVPANAVYTVTTGVPVGTVPSTAVTTVANDSNAAANDDKNHLNTGTRVTVGIQDNASVDFGFYVPLVQFGDRVWLEADADGLAGTGVITPIAGLVITATAGTNIYTATTNSQGYYSFTVAPGLYTVRYGNVPATYGVVLPSATPGGNAVQGKAGSYRETGNPDTSHANGTTVNLVAGEANWQVDFAFHAPHADLHLVKQVNKTVAKTGDTAIYTLVLTNDGPDTATNVTVTDLLPATVLYQSATAQQGAYDVNTGVWTVGTLAVNNSITLTITVKIR